MPQSEPGRDSLPLPLPLAGPDRQRALISEGALAHNLQFLRERTGVPLLWPLKAGAYGHGVHIAARVALRAPEVWGMAVATPAEALALADILQKLGGQKPILLFGPSLPQEWPALVAAGVQLSISTAAEAEQLPPAAQAHLKVNTGMNRTGARPAEALEVGRILAARGQLVGLYSHFSEAEEQDTALSWAQFREFAAVARHFPGALSHMSNSAGVLNLGQLPEMRLARPGLATYGLYPAAHVPELRPAMTFQARVTYLHAAQAGERVSYNGLTTLERPTLIATVGAGYADGYPRRATGQGQMSIAGERRPVLGRVCMDQMMVDATGLEVQVGDWVTLWGGDGPKLSEVAGWAEMSEYELLTRLGERVERVSVP